jgi:hypothetical protein
MFLLAQSSQAQTNPGFAPLFGPLFDYSADVPAPAQSDDQAEPHPFTAEPAANSAAESADEPLYACACGCGIFEVGTASMLPHGAGGMIYVEYDYQDQNKNWSGVHSAPAADNSDKNIRTNFVTLGAEYFFNRSWGIQAELPYDNRHFATESGAPGGGVKSLQWGAFGDLRLQAIYAGFFEDQSLGVSFGAKLPTGNWTHNNRYGDIDRDSELGTGCVDLLGGGFFRHQFAGSVTGFAQIAIDAPVDECQGYRPGLEADAAVGAYYTGFKISGVGIYPLGQILMSERGHDSGPNAAHPIASGYQRLLLSPGLEVHVHPFTIYADIEIPVWQHFTGDQLTAPCLVKVIVSYNF